MFEMLQIPPKTPKQTVLVSNAKQAGSGCEVCTIGGRQQLSAAGPCGDGLAATFNTVRE